MRGKKMNCSRWCGARIRIAICRARILTTCWRCFRTASPRSAAAAERTSTATRSIIACADGAARGWPPSPLAEQFPITQIIRWSSNLKEPSSAPLTRILRSRVLPAACFYWAIHRGASSEWSKARFESRMPTARRPIFLSGWAKHPRAQRSFHRPSPHCAKKSRKAENRRSNCSTTNAD